MNLLTNLLYKVEQTSKLLLAYILLSTTVQNTDGLHRVKNLYRIVISCLWYNWYHTRRGTPNVANDTSDGVTPIVVFGGEPCDRCRDSPSEMFRNGETAGRREDWEFANKVSSEIPGITASMQRRTSLLSKMATSTLTCRSDIISTWFL